MVKKIYKINIFSQTSQKHKFYLKYFQELKLHSNFQYEEIKINICFTKKDLKKQYNMNNITPIR